MLSSMSGDLMTLAFIQNLGTTELLVLLAIALLLFGKRLPEVGRSMGKGIVEFKKGLRDIQEEVDTQASQPQQPVYRAPIAEGQDQRVARGQYEASVGQGVGQPVAPAGPGPVERTN
jgi:TatA/E family protein of Tat protein translocase